MNRSGIQSDYGYPDRSRLIEMVQRRFARQKELTAPEAVAFQIICWLCAGCIVAYAIHFFVRF